jgi:tetratricopeptide (TPR) repeat protein
MTSERARLAEAETQCRDVLAREPRNFDALLFLGVAAYQRGRYPEAVELISRALVVNPSHGPAHSNLGVALEALGEPERAAAAYRRAIALQPRHADAYLNLGSLLAARGAREEAAACYERGLKVDARHPAMHTNLGNVLREMGRLGEAAACHRRSLALDPLRAATHVNLGNVLHEQGRRSEAIACYRQAIALNPRFAAAFCDLGNALNDEGEYQEAIAAYRRALALQPDYARAHAHLGGTLMQSGDLEAADAASREALRLNPDSPHVRFSRALLKLTQGDYAAGLPLYESRFQEQALSRVYSTMHSRAALLAGTPRWQGEDAKGSSLLVWTDEGLGDALMMLRYLPLLKARGVGRLAVYCETALVRLVQSIAQVDEVIPASEPLPAGRFGLQCPIMSLPLAFATRLETIPRAVPYLEVPAALKAERLSGVPRPRIGLLWSGGESFPRNHLRSIRLERLAPLMKIPGLSFVSLQKGEEAAQLGAIGWSIVDRMDECRDLLDTAALVGELDLVIGIDSAVTHLTGALGKPMWLLNRFESDWRWMLGREDSPWYPTIRILRQPRPGDWDSVVARVARELSAFSRKV